MTGGAVSDAVRDGRDAAAAMRRTDPPASYAQIAAALGVSRSTAYRWANPEAFEYDRIRSRKPGGRLALRDADRLEELRARSARRGPRCRRCGADRAPNDPECWRCRLVERHARAAGRIARLLDRGVAADPVALRTADPALRDVDVPLFLRQLGLLGRLDVPEVTTADLAHREIVQGLADARPTAVGALAPVEREAAVVAAGCLVALREDA